MTEKEIIVLKDLAARVPYGPKVLVLAGEYIDRVLTVASVNPVKGTISFVEVADTANIDIVKPCLRSELSLTANERELLSKRKVHEIYDFYNEFMIDYRGLVGEGLAIIASSSIYKDLEYKSRCGRVKPEDIMIGDKFHCITDVDTVTITSFGTDDRADVFGKPYFFNEDGKLDIIEDLEPIELGRKSLEELGFEYEKDSNCYTCPNKDIVIRESDGVWKYTVEGTVKGVHEVQHLLRLC